jgi:hypothetical protein
MTDFLDELFMDQPVTTKPVTKVETKPVTATVHVETLVQDGENTKGVEVKNETQQVDAPLMTGPCVYLSVEMGSTLNLGNYSNGKVKVSLHLPVGVEVILPDLTGKLEKSFEFAKTWVEKRLDGEIQELTKLKGKL